MENREKCKGRWKRADNGDDNDPKKEQEEEEEEGSKKVKQK